ncbi:MAG: YcxB family protein [Cycloclasticus sp.]
MSEISYRLRKVDLVEFNEYHAKMNGGYGNSITRHRVIWPGLVVMFALYVVLTSKDTEMGMYILTGAFVWSLGVPAYMKKKFHEHIEEEIPQETVNEAIGDYTLKVTKLGLMESTESGEKLIKWKKILKLEKSRHHVYLYLGEAAALIIPKEMITDGNAFKVFYNDLIAALKKENAEKA